VAEAYLLHCDICEGIAMSEFMTDVNEMPVYVERDIDELQPWEFNPRTAKEADLNRLIEQIKLLGVYKPFLINQNNIVLGGHRRLEALKKIGVKKVSCSVVKTDNNAQMMDYALSDNDQIGVTNEQAIALFVANNQDVNTKLFAINSSPMKLVSTALAEIEKGEDDEPAPKLREYMIKITVRSKETLENLLVEIQEVCEPYGKEIKGVSVNDED
jgi:hypothetical protein